MRALRLHDDGSIAAAEIEAPAPPGPGEIAVRIEAVALNHLDVWSRRGMAFARRRLPMTVGAEAAGTVVDMGPVATGPVAKGAGATGRGLAGASVATTASGEIAVGRRVALYGARTCGACGPCRAGRENLCAAPGGIHGFHLDGFACERVVLPARQCIPVPAGLSAEAAALAPISFGTPEHMLFDNARIELGESVLVHAAGSGVGSAAIQLARDAGCRVIATAGTPDKVERALAIGAHEAIDYRAERFERVVRRLTGKRGVDVVVEHVGKDTWSGSLLSLAPGGRLVTCGSTSGVAASTNLMMLFQRQLRIIGSFGCSRRNVADALDKLATGRVRPIVDATIGQSDLAHHLSRLERREVFGKIVMRMDA